MATDPVCGMTAGTAAGAWREARGECLGIISSNPLPLATCLSPEMKNGN